MYCGSTAVNHVHAIPHRRFVFANCYGEFTVLMFEWLHVQEAVCVPHAIVSVQLENVKMNRPFKRSCHTGTCYNHIYWYASARESIVAHVWMVVFCLKWVHLITTNTNLKENHQIIDWTFKFKLKLVWCDMKKRSMLCKDGVTTLCSCYFLFYSFFCFCFFCSQYLSISFL